MKPLSFQNIAVLCSNRAALSQGCMNSISTTLPKTKWECSMKNKI